MRTRGCICFVILLALLALPALLTDCSGKKEMTIYKKRGMLLNTEREMYKKRGVYKEIGMLLNTKREKCY